jgi:hypothetical protein
MRISRHPFQIRIVIDQKQPENVEYFNYLSSMITNNATVHGKLNPRCHGKNSFQQEEDSSHQQIGCKFKKKILVKCYI